MLREILYRYWALHRLHLARDVYDLFVQVCPVVFGVTLADTIALATSSSRSRASPRPTPSMRPS